MRKALKTAKYLLIAVYALCGIVALVFLLPKTGWKALNVATGSMRPALPPGSLVIVHQVPYSQLHAGDIITFTNPANVKQTITHRIVETRKIAGVSGVVTKGDANESADAPIVAGAIVGKVVWHAASLGKVVEAVKQPVWLVILVLIPGLVIIFEELRLLTRALGEPPTEVARVMPATPAPLSPTPPSDAVWYLSPTKERSPQRRRSVDGLIGAVVLGLIVCGAIGSTKAQLKSTATLTGNTITTAASSGSNSCPAGSSSVSITNTGQGSTNNVTVTNSCSVTSSDNTNVNVSNSNNQTATSGNASGTNAASGDASNDSSTNTNLNTH